MSKKERSLQASADIGWNRNGKRQAEKLAKRKSTPKRGELE